MKNVTIKALSLATLFASIASAQPACPPGSAQFCNVCVQQVLTAATINAETVNATNLNATNETIANLTVSNLTAQNVTLGNGTPLTDCAGGTVTVNGGLVVDGDVSATGNVNAGGVGNPNQNNYQLGCTPVLQSNCLNLAVGTGTGNINTSCENITLVGNGADANLMSTASDVTAVGTTTLFNNTTGSDNTAVGRQALFFNTTGSSNTALGRRALEGNLTTPITGSHNIGIGTDNGLTLTSGSDNIIIGAGADVATGTFSGCLILGSGVTATAANQLAIGPALSTAATAGGVVTYLDILVNGTAYKIALLAP